MQDHFKILFYLGVQHSYFEKQPCTCLQFQPGKDTAAAFKRFDLTLRNRAGSIELYTTTKKNLSDLFDYIHRCTNTSWFEFEIITLNDHFMLFTELPLDWSGHLEYSSRAAANVQHNGSIELAAGFPDGEIKPAIGKLKIYFEDLLAAGDKHPQFCIRFAARATQWNYYIINRSAVLMNSPAITGKAEISFSGPDRVLTEAGQEALLFSSDSLIPLSELPKSRFDLVNYSAGAGSNSKKTTSKILFKALPVPDLRYSKAMVAPAKKQMSSPMYIYI